MNEENPEKVVVQPQRGYGLGFTTGIQVGEILVLLALSLLVIPSLRETFAGLGVSKAELPWLTRMVTSPFWCWGAPVLLAVVAFYQNLARPSALRVVIALAIAVLGMGLIVATALGLVVPFFLLAVGI